MMRLISLGQPLGEWARLRGVAVRSRREPQPWWGENYFVNSWDVTLRFEHRRMTTPFFTGMGGPEDFVTAPEPCRVLRHLVFDAASFDAARGFDEWIAEMGIDFSEDLKRRRLVKQAYAKVKRQTGKLRKFLGDHYDTVLYHEDLESWCRGQRMLP